MRRSHRAVCWAVVLAMGPAASGEAPDTTSIVYEAVVAGTAQDVFVLWTSVDGVKSFFAPDARVEARVGGRYEMIFDTVKDPEGADFGTKGATILALEEGRRLVFEWKGPPWATEMNVRPFPTRVTVSFEDQSGSPPQSRVRLVHEGFGTGGSWPQAYDKFRVAWRLVLDRLTVRCAGGDAWKVPVSDTKHATGEHGAAPCDGAQSWEDGAVTVRVCEGPDKYQAFDIVIPASAREVWDALTTVDGVNAYYPSQPVIEMVPGGKWDLHGGKPNRVLSFVPYEMFAATGSAPPQFPNVMRGGTWGVFTFEPRLDGQILLSMVSLGWQPGEEWDRAFDYFLKNNPVFLKMIHRRFAQAPGASTERGQQSGSPMPRDVAATISAWRRLDKEIVIPAPLTEVWRAFTTSEGLASWAAPGARIELRPEGSIDWQAKTGDTAESEAGIGGEVLTFVPFRVLSHRGQPVALESGGYRAAETWTVWRFDSLGAKSTRVRYTGIGWGEGVVWDDAIQRTDHAMDELLSALLRRFVDGQRQGAQQAQTGGQ